MKLEPEKSEDWTFLAESNNKESLETRDNLLGFFEILINIDQQIQNKSLVNLEKKSNN